MPEKQKKRKKREKEPNGSGQGQCKGNARAMRGGPRGPYTRVEAATYMGMRKSAIQPYFSTTGAAMLKVDVVLSSHQNVGEYAPYLMKNYQPSHHHATEVATTKMNH